MAFVPGFEHDIFVSYAHVDDIPAPGVKDGWLSTLIAGLRGKLNQKLGRADAYSLWIDHSLAGNARITPDILSTLDRTATLLIILSPGYLASEWCQRESAAFLDLVEKRAGGTSQVFLVERDRVERDELPAALGDLRGYRFWEQTAEGRPPRILGEPAPDPTDPRDERYYELLDELAYDISGELQRRRRPAPETPTAARPDASGVGIFLAEVTDDLDDVRDEVERYVKQAGDFQDIPLQVLPATYYSRDPQSFKASLREDLAGSSLFVQLLSGVAGKRSPDLPQGYAGLQHELAIESGIPVLQWRDQDLDTGQVKDAAYRQLLEGASVQAVGLEEFKQSIIAAAQAAVPEQEPEEVNAFVFVNTESSDLGMAREVCDVLRDHGVAYALPLQSGKPAEIRQDLEQNLRESDAVIVVYGTTTSAWVRHQLRYYWKLVKRPEKALAIYQGPPSEKEPIDFALPKMQTLDCRSGLNRTALGAFLRTLANGHAA